MSVLTYLLLYMGEVEQTGDGEQRQRGIEEIKEQNLELDKTTITFFIEYC